MAKFRRNHGSSGGPALIRVALFAVILVGMIFLFLWYVKPLASPSEKKYDWDAAEYFLPASSADLLIWHSTFALSYREQHEQAEWVAYILRGDQLEQPWNPRKNDYRPDPSIPSRSADPEDYRRSGYDRGHLLPAADRAYDPKALSETFLMSNISPQVRHFNGGIWRELEEQVRYWAKENGKLYVVTGPVLDSVMGQIGNNEVSVPRAYYKVLLDLETPERKGIGFVIPNELSEKRLRSYAVSIDRVEELTNIDFFPQLMTPELEAKLEREYDPGLWPMSEQKYRKRINSWNKQ